jgi:hypothetical protein
MLKKIYIPSFSLFGSGDVEISLDNENEFWT